MEAKETQGRRELIKKKGVERKMSGIGVWFERKRGEERKGEERRRREEGRREVIQNK